MGASPAWPNDNVTRFDALLSQPDDNAADFLDGPADQFRGLAQALFGGRGIGTGADGRQHREGQHDERDMPVPAMPGAGLVVVEAEFIPGGLEAVLDGPATSFHPDQGFDGRAGRTTGGEEGKVVTGDVAADQQASGPCPGCAIGIFVGLEVAEFEIGLVVEAFALGALTRRQTLTRSRIEVLCDLRGGARNDRLVAP